MQYNSTIQLSGFVKETGSLGLHGPCVLSPVELDQEQDREHAQMFNVKASNNKLISKLMLFLEALLRWT